MYKNFQDSPNTNWFKFKRKKTTEPNFPDVIKTFMGRDALNIYLWNLKKQKNVKKALIPAYICQEVPDQFRRNNIEIIYYDISSFILKPEDIEPFLTQKFDIFYYVHYFGIYQKNIEIIIKIIKEKNPDVIIIEDRAHYLSDEYILDDIDSVIYSFRKLLPIPEGGGIYSKINLEFKIKPRMYSNILALLVFLKKKMVGHNSKFSRSNVMKDSLNPSNSLLLASSFSENVINFADLDLNKQLRRELFFLWNKEAKKNNILPVFKNLEEKDIPQGFPVYVENTEEVFSKMLKKGIYLKRHWPLPKLLKNNAPRSYNLSNSVITLPIYENIKENHIKLVSSFLKKVL